MTDISNTKLRRLDITVLLVFLGLMRKRKATEVARDLGLTQSAVSHALRRLRAIFEDELFLRRPHGLEPTAVAVAVEPRIEAAVNSLRFAFSDAVPFEPSSSETTVRIAAYDAELATIVPPLVSHLAEAAPNMRLTARAIAREDALAALSDGEIDVALGYFWKIDDAFIAAPIYEEDYVVVGSRSHYRFRRPLSLDRYAALPHILVSPRADLRGVVDGVLEREGRERRVIASVPLFFPALAAVRDSRAIATLPRRIGESYADAFDLSVTLPPVPIRRFTVSAVRHRRNAANPFHLWLVGIIQELGRRASRPASG